MVTIRDTPFSKEQVYDFLIKFTIRTGYTPSRKEICKGTGIKDVMTVSKYLRLLEDDGLIIYEHNRYRIKNLKSTFKKIDTSVLTEKELMVHDKLIAFVLKNNCIPTEKELSECLPFHPSHVHRYMFRLRKKGFVDVFGHKMRINSIKWEKAS